MSNRPLTKAAREESRRAALREKSRKGPVPLPSWWKSAFVAPVTAVIVALVIAVIAAVLAVLAWLRPAHDGSPSYTAEQTAQAKTNVCSAFAAVVQAVGVNTNALPENPVGNVSVIVNSRLALLGGGAYLRDRVAAEPATPADLANALNSLADTIEQLGIKYLAENNDASPSIEDYNSALPHINELCA